MYYTAGFFMGIISLGLILLIFREYTVFYKQGYAKGHKDGFDAGWIDAERTLFTNYVPKNISRIKEMEG